MPRAAHGHADRHRTTPSPRTDRAPARTADRGTPSTGPHVATDGRRARAEYHRLRDFPASRPRTGTGAGRPGAEGVRPGPSGPRSHAGVRVVQGVRQRGAGVVAGARPGTESAYGGAAHRDDLVVQHAGQRTDRRAAARPRGLGLLGAWRPGPPWRGAALAGCRAGGVPRHAGVAGQGPRLRRGRREPPGHRHACGRTDESRLRRLPPRTRHDPRREAGGRRGERHRARHRIDEIAKRLTPLS
jgi:hypothetical protein